MAAAGFRLVALALSCAACTSVAVDQRTFDGTSWHVAAINNHPAPAGDRFSIQFARGGFTAHMGCNRATGEYRIAGDILVPLMTRTTEMGCETVPPGPIPLMTYEGWGFRILRRPLHMRWINGRRLLLSNGAGSIELERIP